MVPVQRKSVREWSKEKMDDIAEAQMLFSQGFPRWRYTSVKDMVNAGYAFMSPKLTKKVTHRRIETIWQGKARRIDGQEKDALRLAVLEESRREQSELRARLAALDKMLAASDETSACQTLAAVGTQAGRLGGIHHEGDR